MADTKSTDTAPISDETIESIKRKLFDICDYLLAVKHVLNQGEQTHMHVALNVIVNRAGSAADSIILNELKTPGCVGDINDWEAYHAGA